MKIIDAHQHYWQPSRGDYGWLSRAPATLQRPFLPQDLRATRRAAGVSATVLVQAAPSEAETRYLFDLARLDPDVVGVVGWVDLCAPDVEARIDALASDGDGLLRGLRPMAQDIADPDWLAEPALDRAFEHLQLRGLCFDALVTPRQLPALYRRLRRHPGLQAVLDHAAKPPLDMGSAAHWRKWLARLAELPHLHCKLSGLLTLLPPGADPQRIEPTVAELFERFGAERLMWGSDWPVLTTHADYADWLSQARQLARRFAPDHQTEVFAGTAERFYGLSRTPTKYPSAHLDTPCSQGA